MKKEPPAWAMRLATPTDHEQVKEAQQRGRAQIHSFQGFYDWAHGRYHMLEDGYDSWIGDDNS